MTRLEHGLSVLGLAMRAGMVSSGDGTCEKTAKAADAGIILLDAGSAENTRDKYEGISKSKGIALILVPENALGNAIGKPGRMVAVVKKGALQQKIATLLQDGGEA